MSAPPPASGAGHRVLPHTADLILEAWAPTRAACIAEAVRALVGSFAQTSSSTPTRTVPLHFDQAADDELLVSVLDEVIYLMEVFDAVPVDADIRDGETGGLEGFLETAPVSQVQLTGAVPKAIAVGEIAFGFDGSRWSCLVTVDV